MGEMTGILEDRINKRDGRIHWQKNPWHQYRLENNCQDCLYLYREVESKQNMDEQRTLAAMNPKRKLQWINKNPASQLRKGNNCWTIPGIP